LNQPVERPRFAVYGNDIPAVVGERLSGRSTYALCCPRDKRDFHRSA
jgi:ABC-type oligopeptide transport system ATPase subunit